MLNSDGIAIIGSRSCSEEGKEVAKRFAKDLSKQNLTIISGMAIGIDTAAHKGALNAGGITIAVLGCGFNNIFPKENIPLYREIIKTGGAVVTEYLPNTEAMSSRFIARNRIVAGLSLRNISGRSGI